MAEGPSVIDLEAPQAPERARQPPSPVRRHAGLAVTAAVLAVCGASAIGQELTTRPATKAAVLADRLVNTAADTWSPGRPRGRVLPATTVPATTVPALVEVGTTTTTPLRVFVVGEHCWPLGAGAVTAQGTPIMCTRLDVQGQAYDDAMARWRRSY